MGKIPVSGTNARVNSMRYKERTEMPWQGSIPGKIAA